MHISVVIGTARLSRQSDRVAKAVFRVIENKAGYTAEVVDVRDHVTEAVTIPPWGEGGANTNPTEWKNIVNRSDCLVLVIPEYNHSYPGELKLLLDSLWDDYSGKTVGLVGVSAGTLGGARVVDHIRPVLTALNLHAVKEAVHISQVESVVNDDGEFTDEKTLEYVKAMIDNISQLATAFQTMD